jgi:glycosyltransferase involved in cell wall biosynthesis
MKIAQVAPLYESVPPTRYGGTERVVSFLTEELVRQGHDVTLFASGDSITSARLHPCCDRALRLRETKVIDPLSYHVRMLGIVAKQAERFDIVHYHTDYLHYPVTRTQTQPVLTTLHGRLDLPELAPLYKEFSEMKLASISDAQRRPLPFANWIGTVYHGLPAELFHLQEPVKREYLAFLGRVSPEKGIEEAVEIAGRVGMKLRVGVKIDDADREYYETRIRHLFELPWVEYIGEISEREKQELLGNAYATLFPINWPEPFGLVMVESMACGTPVIAFRCGAVPEILEDGITGYVVHTVDEAVDAVERVGSLDRRVCRRIFEERFSAKRMCRDYLRLYERLTQSTHAGTASVATGASATLTTQTQA